ncbi:MAG: response regulator [Candidatus Omnitrophota bacterium]|nr:response regulator [Candidatus Omnitrophota bacterium]
MDVAKRKILLIDDEVSLCKFVKRNLEHTGKFEVTVAHSGEAGVEKAKAVEFDLVITDYKMPGMDGQQVIREIKKMKPKEPVILFSVYHDDPGTIGPGLLGQADGLISKPIEHAELYSVIKKALAKVGKNIED